MLLSFVAILSKSLAKQFIVDSLNKWERRIEVINSSIKILDSNESVINLSITYKIRSTKIEETFIFPFYKEINYFRLPYRTLIDNGAGVTDFSPRGLNMPAQTKYCQFSVTAPLAGSTTANAIICRIQNLPYLQAQTLSLDYLTDGTWQCQASAGIKDAYLPQACQ